MGFGGMGKGKGGMAYDGMGKGGMAYCGIIGHGHIGVDGRYGKGGVSKGVKGNGGTGKGIKGKGDMDAGHGHGPEDGAGDQSSSRN